MGGRDGDPAPVEDLQDIRDRVQSGSGRRALATFQVTRRMMVMG